MRYEDVQTLLLDLINKKYAEPGARPLFEAQLDPSLTIIHFLVSEKNPHFSPTDLFRQHKTSEEKQAIKYFLLLLALEYPGEFNDINDQCLFMRILNAQRMLYTTLKTGQTQSSRDFQWIMTKQGEPPAPNTKKQNKADPIVTFILERAIALKESNKKDAAYRTLQFLIYLHGQQRFTKSYSVLALISQAFALLAEHAMTAYQETFSGDLFLEHINHLVRADATNPTQDMANVLAILNSPHKRRIICERTDAHLIFSRLYHLLPLTQQTPALLAWLANATFSETFPEIELQRRLLLLAGAINPHHTASLHFTRLTQLCIDYLNANDDDERNHVKQALEKQATPEALCLRLQIELIEEPHEFHVDPKSLGGSDTAKRLNATYHYHAVMRARAEITRLNTDKKKQSQLKTQRTLHQALQKAVVDIFANLARSETTPSLSQLKFMIEVLLDLDNTENALRVANDLLLRTDVLAYHEHTSEYQLTLARLRAHEKNEEAADQAFVRAIHLSPLNGKYYYYYALDTEEKNTPLSNQAYGDFIKLSLQHCYPNPDTSPDDAKKMMRAIFSNTLSWLNEQAPNHVGQFYRGALLHWHQAQGQHEKTTEANLASYIKSFHEHYSYDTLKTFADGWEDRHKHLRFEALLTLAKTMNQWRYYKVLFKNEDFLAEKTTEELMTLIEQLPEKRLINRAVALALDPKEKTLYEKMEFHQEALRALKKTRPNPSALFQPANDRTQPADAPARQYKKT